MENGMKVTITANDTTRTARAVFTWTEDGQDCDVVAYGFSDDELDEILEAKGHEGADVAGYSVAIS